MTGIKMLNIASTIVILVSFFLMTEFSCHKKKQVNYPRIVHNSCINKWAVNTGYGLAINYEWHSDIKEEELYFGEYRSMRDIGVGDLKKNTVAIGSELQFDDSIQAANAYNQYLLGIDSIQNARRKIVEEERRKNDSIFKCNHSYNL